MPLVPIALVAALLAAPDAYAVAIAPTTTAAYTDGADALGAPDGRHATVSGKPNTHFVLDLGAATGDLDVYYYGFSLGEQTVVDFLAADGSLIAEKPLNLIGLGNHVTTVKNASGRTYRYVSIRDGAVLDPQKFGIDAVRAGVRVS